MKRYSLLTGAVCAALCLVSCSQISRFENTDSDESGAISSGFTFNGYTNHWQNVYQQQYRYGNLYRINMPDLEKEIAQSRMDIAAKLGLPGLRMQEGFLNGLIQNKHFTLNNPDAKEISKTLKSSQTVLIFAEEGSEAADLFKAKRPEPEKRVSGYQAKADDFTVLDAFILKDRKKTIYIAIGTEENLKKFHALLDNAAEVAGEYDLKRGWFGTATNIQSVTCTPGTPIDVMGRGMNEGNSWFVFSGGYETHSGTKIADWVKETGLPVVTDLGASPLYGCVDWNGFQSQLMSGRDSWFKLREEKGGYLFKRVGAPKGERDYSNNDDYDGFFADPGHEKQINTGDKPFVITTGNLLGGTVNSMVLFNRKGDTFDREKMWEAIMDRRSVAIAEKGLVMGSDRFRNATYLMMLDKDYLEYYFGDRVDISSFIEGTRLYVDITNTYRHSIEGTFALKLPAQVGTSGPAERKIRIAAGCTERLEIDLNPSKEAMAKLNAIGITFDWGCSSKSTMAKLDMPPAVSAHQLLYGSSEGTSFPVSVYNHTDDKEVEVNVYVSPKDDPENKVFAQTRKVEIQKGSYETLSFDLSLPAGSYTITSEAMGSVANTQLGIGSEGGKVRLEEVDLNNDGVNEYIMENDHVRVTLLTTGARVIEYIVKSRNDNVFFKLWPDKPEDVDRPYRDWAFWPFGGFEDFLGQASMETHKVYDAEVIKASGAYAEVRMRGEYYGNNIEKTFTLYGDTPLLGIRFALDMVNPELDVLGPQPILSIGKEHGTEDRFIIPETIGNQEYIMRPKQMYGKILDLREGWNAGYDTREDISFVGAYPVHRPFYLHMWMNLDTNPDSHYPYVELQPWVPLYHNSTSYFSYYMWADGGSWEKGLDELRKRNLITER